MSETTFIYALRDPDTNDVRYVGKANNPLERFGQHIKDLKRNDYRTRWIKNALQRGTPVLEIVDEVPVLEWPMWEVAYIQFFKDEGCRLTNGNVGGIGGHNPTIETRKKMSLASTGRLHSEEFKRNVSARHRGKIVSEDTRKKMSEAKHGIFPGKRFIAAAGDKNLFFGKTHSLETKEKISQANSGANSYFFGKQLSPEHREKIRAAHVGIRFSPARCAAISAGKLKKKAKV